MTTTTDGPRIARATWTESVPLQAPERRSFARWRIALRMSLRQALRSRPSTLLVVLLVALPMAAVSGTAVYAASLMPSAAQRADAQLGEADAWLQPTGFVEGTRQYLDAPGMVYLVDETAQDLGWIDPPSSVPPFVDTERLIRIQHAPAAVTTEAGIGSFTVTIGDAWDPLLDGRYTLVEGRAVASPDEVLATPATLKRLGAAIGDEITSVEPAATVTVVGTMTSRLDADEANMLFAGEDGPFSSDDPLDSTIWYAEGWHPTAADVYALNGQGIAVFDRVLSQNPGENASPSLNSSSGTSWALYSAALAALVFCTYVVLLLAGSAFSVSAKRQQRSLAVTASLGASRGDVFRIVVFQGGIMGIAGGTLGSAAGISVAALARSGLDDGTVDFTWGLKVPWLLIGGLIFFSAVVGTLAALLPARQATRGDVLEALRGSRRPVAVSARRPKAGGVMIFLGLALVAGGVIAVVATYSSSLHGAAESDPIYATAMIAMIAGPLLLQIGVMMAGHWLLAIVAKALSSFSVSARLAGRDGVANPGRSVPAFGAIAACAFLATASFGGVAVVTDMTSESSTYQVPSGSVYAMVGTELDDGARPNRKAELVDPTEDAAQQAVDMFVDAGASSVGVVQTSLGADVEAETGKLAGDAEQTLISPEIRVPERCAGENICEPSFSEVAGNWASPLVVNAADLDTVLGVTISNDEREAFASGAAIVTDPQWLTNGNSVRLNEWRWADLYDENIDSSGADAVRSETLDAHLIKLPLAFDPQHQVYISPATANGLSIEVRPSTVIASFDNVTNALVDSLTADAETITAASSANEIPLFISVSRADEPPQAAPWLWLILGAASVLVVAASAVALGLSRFERRPDDATLAAVGAEPLIRRWVNALQALVTTGLGCVTGTIAGLMPVLGVVVILQETTGEGPALAEIPWGFTGLLALALPAMVALASYVIPPRRPDLTHRTAIA